MTTAPPTPEPAALVSSIFHSVWHGILTAQAAAPWIVPALAMVIAVAAVRSVRRVIYPSNRRDPVRLFPTPVKAEILARAGDRCERQRLLTGRCPATDQLQADHVVPWSRSGPTTISNGQALCKRHNRDKSAKVPFALQRRALEKRRENYPGPSGRPDGRTPQV